MSAVAATTLAPDQRRLTEADPDVQRVKARWERRLVASVRQLQRDIAAGGELGIASAQSAFIHRHLQLLREAYLDGHREGQRDYWDEVSRHPARWARQKRVAARESVIQKRLLFYGAASVVKLAREAAQVYKNGYTRRRTSKRTPGHRSSDSATAATTTPHAAVTPSATLADPPPDLAFDKFTAWTQPRVGLQADVTWSGFQDGYLDAASADAVGLRLQLWWELEPGAQHCADCPAIADASPYDPPGSGGNELTATPGDGSTQCGANCKCSLRYGWTDLRGLGATPRENELLIPSDVRPATGPSEWEQQRQVAINQTQGQQPGQMGTRAPSTRQLPLSPSEWERRRAEAIRQAQGIVPWEQQLADRLRRATPLSWLNDEQRQALDDIRGIEQLWEVVAEPNGLPPFEVYFDPESRNNLWMNPDLAGLDAAQRELVARYFRALGDFQDASPLADEPPPAGPEQPGGGGGAHLQ